jgi:hypothetical protein
MTYKSYVPLPNLHVLFSCCLQLQRIPTSTSTYSSHSTSNLLTTHCEPRASNPLSNQPTMFSLFLQLCLAALCSAAPIADDFTTLNSNATQYGTGGGIIGFIVLVLDILVWSKQASPKKKEEKKPSTTTRKHTNATLLPSSRGPQIKPPRQPQAPVVRPRLRLPHRRYHYLLASFRPPEVS